MPHRAVRSDPIIDLWLFASPPVFPDTDAVKAGALPSNVRQRTDHIAQRGLVFKRL